MIILHQGIKQFFKAHARRIRRSVLPPLPLSLHHLTLNVALSPHATTSSLCVLAQTGCKEVGDVVITRRSRLPTLVAVGCGTCRRLDVGFRPLGHGSFVVEVVSAALTRQRRTRC
jgi:hypothetical protein